ncbi:APC family permease [Phototrophicus methaneseepsis]|uniref:APC family permease n=1 Tax=Phototrophicus methaneseepsis TaxID=2710758 RepID=A0A7S8EAP7_9CHLR|nr:APC family permease [Phototrophicus methaneseepsis]QPC83374.1 APC family permease [Phototrophicus methaneseepsis]
MKQFSLGRTLFGKPLETKDLPHQAINRPIGLAVFASDALSSTAYATQEMLIILSLAGGGAALFGISIPLAIAIAVLLTIVTVSYRQTIYAYPNGGGAYIVARDNLGELPAQVAGAALLTDYILTVAVSISAGVEQITSGFQWLLPFRVEIAVAIIILMTIVNLRGVKESGRIFAIPTYFFLGMMLLTLGVGFFRYFAGNLGMVTGVEPIHHADLEPLTLFLILRAFSSGCTALTGIEAISNGITAFKEPRSHNAATTLMWMSGILITLFLGITVLGHQVGVQPSEVETVISQMGRTIFGDGSLLWYLLLAGTALILLMAANTSYADFPRLAALHAGDGFLPRQLTYRGGRLVFSWGIMVLAGTAIALVIVAGASTTALIPLYAVGVFLSFTISQTGMVVRLNKIGKMKPGETVQGLETIIEYDPHWRYKQIISAVGALCTFVVMVIFAITKFASGAWFVVLLIPVLVFIFFRIHYHYKDVARLLSLEGARPELQKRPVRTLILVDDVHAETARLVNFAKSLDHPWQAVHIGIHPEKTESVQQKWKNRIGEGELVIIPSPYRLLAEPIREYITQLQNEEPGCFVHVILGQLVMDTFWEQALHQNSAFIFNLALGHMEHVVVTSVPYQIRRQQEDDAEEALAEEEPSDVYQDEPVSDPVL